LNRSRPLLPYERTEVGRTSHARYKYTYGSPLRNRVNFDTENSPIDIANTGRSVKIEEQKVTISSRSAQNLHSEQSAAKHSKSSGRGGQTTQDIVNDETQAKSQIDAKNEYGNTVTLRTIEDDDGSPK
jgi:hypothetical protein